MPERYELSSTPIHQLMAETRPNDQVLRDADAARLKTDRQSEPFIEVPGGIYDVEARRFHPKIQVTA